MLDCLLTNRSWVLDTIVADDLSSNKYVQYADDMYSAYAANGYRAINRVISEELIGNALVMAIVDAYDKLANIGDLTGDALSSSLESIASGFMGLIGEDDAAALVKDMHDSFSEKDIKGMLNNVLQTEYVSKALGVSLSAEDSRNAEITQYTKMLKELKDAPDKVMKHADTIKLLSEAANIGKTEEYTELVHILTNEQLPGLYIDMQKYLTKLEESYLIYKTPGHRELLIDNYYCYMQSLAKRSSFIYYDEFADQWRRRMDIYLVASEVSDALSTALKTGTDLLSEYNACINTYADLQNMHTTSEKICGTFSRLEQYTDDDKLINVIEGYNNILKRETANQELSSIDKLIIMNNNKLFSVAQSAIKDKISEKLKDYIEERTSINTQYVAFGAKAGYMAVKASADLGSWIANGTMNTQKVVDKIIEYKYTDELLACAYGAYSADLESYMSGKTEEKAELVIEDLRLLKRIKLHEIDLINDYNKALLDKEIGGKLANLPNLINGNEEVSSEDIDAVCDMYRDALLAATIYDTEYSSSSILTLESDEVYTTSSGYNKVGRMTGGVVCSGGNTISLGTEDDIYIPFLIANGDTNILVTNGSLTIGVMSASGGKVTVYGDVTVQSDLTLNNAPFNITVGNGACMRIEGGISALNSDIKLSDNIDLTVEDGLSATGGSLIIDNGTLRVNGDFSVENTAITLGTLGRLTAESITLGKNSSAAGGVLDSAGSISVADGVTASGVSLNAIDGFSLASGAKLSSCAVNVVGNAEVHGVLGGTLTAQGDVCGSGSITSLRIIGTRNQTINGISSVETLELSKGAGALTLGNAISITKSVKNPDTRVINGKNAVLQPGGDIIGSKYNSDLTVNGVTLNKDMTFAGSLYADGDVSLCAADIQGTFTQRSGTLLKGALTVAGDACFSGGMQSGAVSLTVSGDVSSSDGNEAVNIELCGKMPQSLSGKLKCSGFTNNNTSPAGAAINSELTVTGTLNGAGKITNGKNIIMDGASFGIDTLNGDVTIKSLSGNMANINGTAYITGEVSAQNSFTARGLEISSAGSLALSEASADIGGSLKAAGNITLSGSGLKTYGTAIIDAALTADDKSSLEFLGDVLNNGTISSDGAAAHFGDISGGGAYSAKTLTLCGNVTQETDGDIYADRLLLSGKGALNIKGKLYYKTYENSGKPIINASSMLESAAARLTSDAAYTDGFITDADVIIDGADITANKFFTTSTGNISVINGGSLTVDGKLTITDGGTINIGEGSQISVKGAAVIGDMSEIIIDGRLTLWSDTSIVSGTISGKGELAANGDLYSENAVISGLNTLSVTGLVPQEINLPSVSCVNVTVKNKSRDGVKLRNAIRYSGSASVSGSNITGIIEQEQKGDI
ncbi:MAG: beta strand repeat-containing protein [Candidatus Ornithomonoglobus sp.]